MNKLILCAVVVVAACQPDQRSLEKKIDDLSKDVKEIKTSIAQGRAGAAAQPPRPKAYGVPIGGPPVDGPADAKVTLVKAYDYACPYCEKVRDTMDDLRKKYGNDLRIVFKQFVVHPQTATTGALAVCAANKQ